MNTKPHLGEVERARQMLLPFRRNGRNMQNPPAPGLPHRPLRGQPNTRFDRTQMDPDYLRQFWRGEKFVRFPSGVSRRIRDPAYQFDPMEGGRLLRVSHLKKEGSNEVITPERAAQLGFPIAERTIIRGAWKLALANIRSGVKNPVFEYAGYHWMQPFAVEDIPRRGFVRHSAMPGKWYRSDEAPVPQEWHLGMVIRQPPVGFPDHLKRIDFIINQLQRVDILGHDDDDEATAEDIELIQRLPGYLSELIDILESWYAENGDDMKIMTDYANKNAQLLKRQFYPDPVWYGVVLNSLRGLDALTGAPLNALAGTPPGFSETFYGWLAGKRMTPDMIANVYQFVDDHVTWFHLSIYYRVQQFLLDIQKGLWLPRNSPPIIGLKRADVYLTSELQQPDDDDDDTETSDDETEFDDDDEDEDEEGIELINADGDEFV